MTIELDEAEHSRLEELAAYHGVSLTKLMKESAERIVAEDKAFLAAVQRGRDDVKAGRVFTHEEVVARALKRREELLSRAEEK
ncbi:MAG TPA: hypothetical protein VF138_06845 [Caulobacteraceae bacterium]